MIASQLARTLVLGSALAFAACGGEGLVVPREGEPAHINVVHGNEQSGRAGSVLADSVVVLVTDSKDREVANATVNFTFPDADAEAAPTTVTTNSDGVAWAKVTLGAPVGPVTGVAEVPVAAGVTPVRAEFTAVTLPGDANGIVAVSGDPQSAPVNTALPAPLVVRVTDESGNPISGQQITWSVTGGGSVSSATTVTDGDGQSSVTRTLGPTAGQQTTQATAPGLAGSPVTFTHTATAGTAAGVNKVSGDGQSAQAGTELTLPLVVRVLDDGQNPIPNRDVTWIVTGGGGSVSEENTRTNAQGETSVRWTLGPSAGANSVNAVVSGVGTATFTATGTAGTPSASNSTVAASPGSITAGSGTSTVTVTVRDAGNNPVAGVSVSIASSGTGNTISPESASTGANGVATFTFSSTVAETKTITATAGGVTISNQATITVNKAGSTIEITEDEPDGSTVGQAITVEFTVTGAGGGTPTGDVTVTLSGGPESCRATLSNGAGSCQLTPLTPGTSNNNRRVLTATYGGDAGFSGDTDTENHQVNPVPSSNNPPTAAFNPPSCTAGQPCQFNDGSSDSDGSVVGWLWDFGDGQTSPLQNPSVTFAEGTKSVKLTVTDDDGATSSVIHDVSVARASGTAPVAADDAYSTQPGTGGTLTVGEAEGVLANDSDPGDIMFAELVQGSGPSNGTVNLDDDGSFDYQATVPGATSDTFRYLVRDLDGNVSNEATVTITIVP